MISRTVLCVFRGWSALSAARRRLSDAATERLGGGVSVGAERLGGGGSAATERPRMSVSAAAERLGGGELLLSSCSTDIFQNLALEDWIHQNLDLEKRRVLLLWRSRSAVECDLRLMARRGVPLARRRSGGGTVFHDLGNVNLTFFTSRRNYDRQRNLRVVTAALSALRPQLDVRATERFDVLLDGRYKISGTAAKLGRTAAYHHCTLLCSADRSLLSAVLQPSVPGISSNATPSVPATVINLQERDATLEPQGLMRALAAQYNTEFGLRCGVTPVDPADESEFPGIMGAAAELQSWDWTFARTPKFSVRTELRLTEPGGSVATATVGMEVKGGRIERCQLGVPGTWLPATLCADLGSVLEGSRFCRSDAGSLAATFLRSVSPGSRDAEKVQDLCEKLVSLM